MNKNRWPKSIHCQMEAVFHSIRCVRVQKSDNAGGIRSFGTWRIYKYEAQRFASFMASKERKSILNIRDVHDDMAYYLNDRLDDYVKNRRSRQSFETTLSALAKFQHAINHYIGMHLSPDHPKLDAEHIRMDFYSRSKKLLRKSSRKFQNRAYSDPIGLIEAISDGQYQLQASLQYEGGLRAEGAGAPSNLRLKNPLTSNSLRGIIPDPVSGSPVGVVSSREKGGKETKHYISVETYYRLKEYIEKHGKLETDYAKYVEAINRSALLTNQYFSGRGSHGLKHNFAQERYQQCVARGMSHERALQNTSLELAHFRLQETLSYTRGR